MKNKIYQIVTDQIIEQLEQVDLSDYTKPWFCVGHSPINLRGTAYRGINHVLLSHSGLDSNIWATFKQWSQHDCKVRKGEKSRVVVLWKFFREGEEESEGNGQELNKPKAVMTRYFRVFNSAQVDGEYARIAEQKFKDKLKTNNPIAEAENFVTSYVDAERLPVRPSDHAYYSGGMREHIAMPELARIIHQGA